MDNHPSKIPYGLHIRCMAKRGKPGQFFPPIPNDYRQTEDDKLNQDIGIIENYI